MKLLLINPPLGQFDSAELAPPLGLLQLAANARAADVEVQLLDLNLLVHRPASDSPDGFYDHVVELAAAAHADEVGITSMGVNSHVAVCLANRLAEELCTPVVLGGHHLSTIAPLVESICHPMVVVATPALRASSDGSARWWGLRPSQTPLEVTDLFAVVSLPAYFRDNRRRLANIELAPGCKYQCAFCYSPAAHPEWVALRPSAAVGAFGALSDLGFRHAFVVDDNLTNSPVILRDFCTALHEARTGLTWNGYATLPDLDPELLALMRKAGCTNLYLGIDSADPAQQSSWRKRFYKSTRALISLLEAASDVGMTLTCAFILDPAPGGEVATSSSLELAAILRNHGAAIRLSVLTSYPGSALASRQRPPEGVDAYSEARPAILMDLPAVVVTNPLAREYPDAFPWHRASLPEPDWTKFLLSVHTAQTVLNDATPPDMSGRRLWQTCCDAAATLEAIPLIRKVFLRDEARRAFHESAAHAA
jgi:hypothetical protein